MGHADVGKQKRTKVAKRKSASAQRANVSRFRRTLGARRRRETDPNKGGKKRRLQEARSQAGRNLPSLGEVQQRILPTLEEREGAQFTRPPVSPGGATNVSLATPTQIPGTGVNALTEPQAQQFQTLVDQGHDQATALRVAQQGPAGGTVTGTELLQPGANLFQNLFPVINTLLSAPQTIQEAAGEFAGPDRESPEFREASGLAQGLQGQQLQEFITQEGLNTQFQGGLTAGRGEQPSAIASPAGPGALLQQGQGPVTSQGDETAGSRRFAGTGDFAGSADALAKQVANWDYNIGLMDERVFAGAPPNYLNKLMLEDMFEGAGLSLDQIDAYLKDWGYTNLGGEIYFSPEGTAYIGGEGFQDPGFGGGGGGGGGSGGVGAGGFPRRGRGGGGGGRRVFGGGGGENLFLWRITA